MVGTSFRGCPQVFERHAAVRLGGGDFFVYAEHCLCCCSLREVRVRPQRAQRLCSLHALTRAGYIFFRCSPGSLRCHLLKRKAFLSIAGEGAATRSLMVGLTFGDGCVQFQEPCP